MIELTTDNIFNYTDSESYENFKRNIAYDNIGKNEIFIKSDNIEDFIILLNNIINKMIGEKFTDYINEDPDYNYSYLFNTLNYNEEFKDFSLKEVYNIKLLEDLEDYIININMNNQESFIIYESDNIIVKTN